jgi:hypothetical protein
MDNPAVVSTADYDYHFSGNQKIKEVIVCQIRLTFGINIASGR